MEEGRGRHNSSFINIRKVGILRKEVEKRVKEELRASVPGQRGEKFGQMVI